MKTRELYEKPTVEMLEIQIEGVIANSPMGSSVGFSEEEVNGSARSKRFWPD